VEKINSYDVFDTLIARRFVNNDAILSAMEHRINISNFAFNRKQSDDGTKSLYEIYRDLANKGIIPSDKIMEYYKLEVSLEKHQIFGIKENIDKVQDGDLLISDMYFSGADILELVRFAGCDKQITIYQSNSDKRTGVLWDKLKNTNLINTHLGDNTVSDVENPKLRNIKAEHYPNAVQFTGVENYLYSKGMAMLGSLVREIRLKYNQQNIKLFELSNQ
jgi:predicted HAD superfamily hydrolase